MDSTRSVVLTRPAAESAQWQRSLQAENISTEILPLIEIGPHQQPAACAAVDAAVNNLHSFHAVMFVSINAVRFFLSCQPEAAQRLQDAVLQGQTRLWAPGPGTAQSLQAAGFSNTHIDAPRADAAQFDSESLWEVVHTQSLQGQRVLIVRGASTNDTDAAAPPARGSGRQWLEQQLCTAGAQVEFVSVYTRQAPESTPALLQRITQLHQSQPIWWFSSSEAIAHLLQLAPSLSWSGQSALTTHPRIAAAAQAAGFGHVGECKPTATAVTASIKSFL